MKYIINILILLLPVWLFSQDVITHNGQPMTHNGDVRTHAEEYVNEKYIEFGGTNEYLSYASTINLGTTHSICFWDKSDQDDYGFSIGTATKLINFLYFSFTNKIYYGDDDEYGAVTFTRDNTWTFYCLIRDGTSVDIYVDGTYFKGMTLSTSGDMSYLYVGRYRTSYAESSADELSIYNKVLTNGTGSEMELLYGGGTPQTAGNPEDITGLIHYLNFEQTITTVTDQITDEVLSQNNMESTDIKEY